MALVEYDCGCIGFPHDAGGRYMVLSPCSREPRFCVEVDHQIHELSRFEAMDPTDELAFIHAMCKQAELGNKYEKMRDALATLLDLGAGK